MLLHVEYENVVGVEAEAVADTEFVDVMFVNPTIDTIM